MCVWISRNDVSGLESFPWFLVRGVAVVATSRQNSSNCLFMHLDCIKVFSTILKQYCMRRQIEANHDNSS